MTLPVFDLVILSLGALGLGMVLLMRGGDWTIEGAVFLAEKAGVSKMLIGFTLVAAGTSLPEMLVSVNANLNNAPGIALGNVIGSNIANILLVLGATAMLHPVVTRRTGPVRDLVMMMLATALLIGLMQFNVIDRWVGLLMVVLLAGYMFWQFRTDQGAGEAMADEVGHPRFASTGAAVATMLGGFVAVAAGVELLVRGATVMATLIGVPEAVIGMTIVAFGTSLPELATSIAATLKRHTDVLIGNVIGSNVFNILLILGVTAGIKPLVITDSITIIEQIVLFGVSLGLAVLLLWHARVGRTAGSVMVLGYVGFVLWQFRDTLGLGA